MVNRHKLVMLHNVDYRDRSMSFSVSVVYRARSDFPDLWRCRTKNETFPWRTVTQGADSKLESNGHFG